MLVLIVHVGTTTMICAVCYSAEADGLCALLIMCLGTLQHFVVVVFQNFNAFVKVPTP